MECITETISEFLVKFLMPRKPLSCWSAIVMAAPPMKPTIAAWDKKSIRNPNLRNPRDTCVIPAKKVAVKANLL